MYRILMDVCCWQDHAETPSHKEVSMELAIENLIALILLDLFEVIVIEGLRVVCLPATLFRPALCSFQMQAACSEILVALSADSLESKLEDILSCALLERFSTVMIDTISVRQERNAAPNLAALPRSA